jgi:hypothetical protein
LKYCDVNADCRADGACICGLCTVTCQSDMECARGAQPASCVSPAAVSGKEACAAIVQSSGQQICLADCANDSECGVGSHCTEGACWPRPAGLVDARGPRGLDASIDIGNLDAAESFDTPTLLPLPKLQIQSAADAPSILGVWEDLTMKGGQNAGTMRLEIRESASDGLTGTLSFPCSGQCQYSGPIAPAAAPNIGYPTEFNSRDQNFLRMHVLSQFSYRIFDGRNTGDGFRFWFSNNDVWRDWCTLQTPYPVPGLNGKAYACIADAKPLELALGDGDALIGKESLCASDTSVCSCSATACTFNPQTSAHDVDLVREGDTLKGFLSIGDTQPVTLQHTAAVAP